MLTLARKVEIGRNFCFRYEAETGKCELLGITLQLRL